MVKAEKADDSRMDRKIKWKEMLKKAWDFIWNDDSLLSWIVNVVLAFVIIKFIVYPGLGFAFGTSHPVVAVVSGSMEHDGSFDDWWNSRAVCNGVSCTQMEHYAMYGITKEQFLKFRFRNGFNTGDIILLKGKPPADIQVGDVIVFQGGKRDPVIHRVIKKWYQEGHYYFQTKGDHNPESINFGPLSEINIRDDKIIGVAAWRIPMLGWIKIGFTKLLQAVMLP